MANLNKVLLIGRLTRDPELRYIPSGSAVAKFGLAVNRVWNGQNGQKNEETTFVDITLWARQAELASEYLHKGDLVYIEGRLQLDTWNDKEGQKRSKLYVTGERMQFLNNPRSGSGGGPSGGSRPEFSETPPPSGAPVSHGPSEDFGSVPPEGDIPF